jgi:hypothetical protein
LKAVICSDVRRVDVVEVEDAVDRRADGVIKAVLRPG